MLSSLFRLFVIAMAFAVTMITPAFAGSTPPATCAGKVGADHDQCVDAQITVILLELDKLGGKAAVIRAAPAAPSNSSEIAALRKEVRRLSAEVAGLTGVPIASSPEPTNLDGIEEELAGIRGELEKMPGFEGRLSELEAKVKTQGEDIAELKEKRQVADMPDPVGSAFQQAPAAGAQGPRGPAGPQGRDGIDIRFGGVAMAGIARFDSPVHTKDVSLGFARADVFAVKPLGQGSDFDLGGYGTFTLGAGDMYAFGGGARLAYECIGDCLFSLEAGYVHASYGVEHSTTSLKSDGADLALGGWWNPGSFLLGVQIGVSPTLFTNGESDSWKVVGSAQAGAGFTF